MIDPNKYIVFKREDLIQLFGELALPPWEDDEGKLIGGNIDCAPIASTISRRIDEKELKDAVVIRKRDKLAAGVLYGYATSCWTTADVLLEVGKDDEAKQLTAIGDFFNEQYEDSRRIQGHLPTL